jgi:Flp pilus assembly pilin Flp
MKQFIVSDEIQAQRGIAIPEYSILLGLVTILAIGGLTLLGDATQSLFSQSGDTLRGSNSMALFNQNGASNSGTAPYLEKKAVVFGEAVVGGAPSTLSLKGGGYLNMAIDPATGQPVLKVVNGSSGVNVNVNSVEGSHYNVLGSVMLASKLEELANQQTDPKVKDYYNNLAKYAYYLGGAEGVMDNVKQVAWENVSKGTWDPKTGMLQTYTLGDGLRDVYSYQQQLQSLLSNPPSDINPQELKQVMPYALDVANIAQNYVNTFDKFIDANGQVKQNFGDPGQCTLQSQSMGLPGGCNLGTPSPGAALANVANAVASPPNSHEMLGIPYDQLVSLSQLKINANKVLAAYDVSDTPVVATFTDAKTADTHAETTATP